MMCHPILDSHGEVIAVAQVINKGKTLYYGNTGCGVFKAGIQTQKGFWLKINCSQMKSLNFVNWCPKGPKSEFQSQCSN